jgi:hypothetical protein
VLTNEQITSIELALRGLHNVKLEQTFARRDVNDAVWGGRGGIHWKVCFPAFSVLAERQMGVEYNHAMILYL